MTKSEGTQTPVKSDSKAARKNDRHDRAARALRENLKKRKQQLKAREIPSE